MFAVCFNEICVGSLCQFFALDPTTREEVLSRETCGGVVATLIMRLKVLVVSLADLLFSVWMPAVSLRKMGNILSYRRSELAECFSISCFCSC